MTAEEERIVDEKLAFASAAEQRELVATKQVSPVELTEMYFNRIERLDSQLNCYLTLARDEAMEAARAAEQAVVRGDDLGPLHGVPISIKDLELSKGIRSTGGSLIFKDRVPDEDSVVVERVRSSGAIILGKTNTPEFGLLGATENRLGDHCRNPWNTERTTGGSSGGAGGALVAGLCAVATGSDGGGSIRIPASFCGTYGIKPTQGRVPRYGGKAATVIANQTSQSGPMSRTVLDSAVLLQVLAGHDPRDASSLRETPPDFVAALNRDVRGLRIAWSPDYGYAPVEPEVVDVCAKAAQVFEELGCSVADSAFALDAPYDPFMTIFSTNAYAGYGSLLESHGDKLTWYARAYPAASPPTGCPSASTSWAGRATRRRCAASAAFERARPWADQRAPVSGQTGADYARALGQLDRMKAQMANLFEEYDLLLSPTRRRAERVIRPTSRWRRSPWANIPRRSAARTPTRALRGGLYPSPIQ